MSDTNDSSTINTPTNNSHMAILQGIRSANDVDVACVHTTSDNIFTFHQFMTVEEYLSSEMFAVFGDVETVKKLENGDVLMCWNLPKKSSTELIAELYGEEIDSFMASSCRVKWFIYEDDIDESALAEYLLVRGFHPTKSDLCLTFTKQTCQTRTIKFIMDDGWLIDPLQIGIFDVKEFISKKQERIEQMDEDIASIEDLIGQLQEVLNTSENLRFSITDYRHKTRDVIDNTFKDISSIACRIGDLSTVISAIRVDRSMVLDTIRRYQERIEIVKNTTFDWKMYGDIKSVSIELTKIRIYRNDGRSKIDIKYDEFM